MAFVAVRRVMMAGILRRHRHNALICMLMPQHLNVAASVVAGFRIDAGRGMRVHFRRVGIELAFQVAAHHLVAGIIMRVCAFALKQTASRFFRRRIAGIRMVMRALAFRQAASVRPGHFVAAVIMDMRHVGVRRNVLGANQRACFRHAIRRVLVPFTLKQTASRFFCPIARIRVDVPLAFRQRAGQLFLPIVIYYVTDEQQQSQYINMFKAAKMDAVILTHNIDQPFISQLEQKNEGIKFQRIDADVTDALKSKTSKKAEKEMEEQAESISKLMKKALKNDKITIKVEKLKNKKISSMITLSEESRRMQDMMKMYSMPGMDMSAFGGEGETLILNANHPLVQYITEHQDGENAEMICEQLYDLAKLQHAPLSADAMTKFVARSNDIMMLLTK